MIDTADKCATEAVPSSAEQRVVTKALYDSLIDRKGSIITADGIRLAFTLRNLNSNNLCNAYTAARLAKGKVVHVVPSCTCCTELSQHFSPALEEGIPCLWVVDENDASVPQGQHCVACCLGDFTCKLPKNGTTYDVEVPVEVDDASSQGGKGTNDQCEATTSREIVTVLDSSSDSCIDANCLDSPSTLPATPSVSHVKSFESEVEISDDYLFQSRMPKLTSEVLSQRRLERDKNRKGTGEFDLSYERLDVELVDDNAKVESVSSKPEPVPPDDIEQPDCDLIIQDIEVNKGETLLAGSLHAAQLESPSSLLKRKELDSAFEPSMESHKRTKGVSHSPTTKNMESVAKELKEKQAQLSIELNEKLRMAQIETQTLKDQNEKLCQEKKLADEKIEVTLEQLARKQRLIENLIAREEIITQAKEEAKKKANQSKRQTHFFSYVIANQSQDLDVERDFVKMKQKQLRSKNLELKASKEKRRARDEEYALLQQKIEEHQKVIRELESTIEKQGGDMRAQLTTLKKKDEEISRMIKERENALLRLGKYDHTSSTTRCNSASISEEALPLTPSQRRLDSSNRVASLSAELAQLEERREYLLAEMQSHLETVNSWVAHQRGK